jgi:hypothetical protein
LGFWQTGPFATGPGTLQQISPAWQHPAPQQLAAAPQSCGEVQGGVPHFRLSQYGALAGQSLPQAPQLVGSFSGFTQASPQQTNGAAQLLKSHAAVVELLLVVLVDDVVVLVSVELVVVAPPEPVVALEPPFPPGPGVVDTEPLHPRAARSPRPIVVTRFMSARIRRWSPP